MASMSFTPAPRRLTVGETIRGVRERKREEGGARTHSLRWLATETGLDHSLLGKIERGERIPDEAELAAIAKAMRLDLASLKVMADRERRHAGDRAEDALASLSDHTAARRLQASLSSWEVGLTQIHYRIDAQGNLTIRRSHRDCQPRTNHQVEAFVFREDVVGGRAAAVPARQITLDPPPGLGFDLSSKLVEGCFLHELRCRRPWARDNPKGTVSFSTESRLDGAFDTTRSGRGAVSHVVWKHTQRLELVCEIPASDDTAQVEPWAWWGPSPIEAGESNLIRGPIAAAYGLEESEADGVKRCVLTADEPLIGICFAIVWSPGPREGTP